MIPSRERTFLPSPPMTATGYTRSSTEFKGVKPKGRHLVSHFEVLFISIQENTECKRSKHLEKVCIHSKYVYIQYFKTGFPSV